MVSPPPGRDAPVVRGRPAVDLAVLAEALVRAVSLTDVAVAAATHGPAAAGAEWSHVVLFDHDGNVHSSVIGGLGASARPMSQPPLDQPPWDEALAQGRILVLQSPEDLLRRYPAVTSTFADSSGTIVLCPLQCAGRSVGIVLLAFGRPGSLSASGRERVGRVATLCALAAERAVLYDTENVLVQKLQRAVLPEAVPDVEGLLLASRYLPSERALGAGGDWYDVIALPEQRTGLVVGDIAGHGLEAASLMASLRSALRAYALVEPSPGAILERLNEYANHFAPEHIATVFVAVFDPDSDDLCFANAGHPPALLVEQGTVQPLAGPGGPGPPVGSQPGTRYPHEKCAFPTGSALLLYTDGLVERRGEPLDFGFERLNAAVAKVAGVRPDELSDRLVAEMLAGVELSDDVATLVAERWLPVVPARSSPPAEERDETAEAGRFDLSPLTPSTEPVPSEWHPRPLEATHARSQRFAVVPEQSAIVLEVRSSVGPIAFGALGLEGFVEATTMDDGRIDTSGPPIAHLEVMVNRLTSGNSLYDAELLRHIDARRYPTAFVDLHSASPSDSPLRYDVTGELNFRGVIRAARGTVTAALSGPWRLVVDGEETVDMRDFGIPPPALFMIRIEPEVLLRLHLEAVVAEEI